MKHWHFNNGACTSMVHIDRTSQYGILFLGLQYYSSRVSKVERVWVWKISFWAKWCLGQIGMFQSLLRRTRCREVGWFFYVVKWVLSQELLLYAVRILLSLPQFIILPFKGWRLETPIASWKKQSLWQAYFREILTGAFKTIVNKSIQKSVDTIFLGNIKICQNN